MCKLHGNIHTLENDWLYGKIFNLLKKDTGLDGHYTVLFKQTGEYLVIKYADYSTTNVLDSYNLTNSFNIIKLSKKSENFIKDVVERTIMSLQFFETERKKRMGTLWVFKNEEYSDYEIQLNNIIKRLK